MLEYVFVHNGALLFFRPHLVSSDIWTCTVHVCLSVVLRVFKFNFQYFQWHKQNTIHSHTMMVEISQISQKS